MRVFELMTKSVHTVPPAMDASEAWELMRQRAIHHLVVMQGSTIVGVVSERDIGGRAGAGVRAGRTVADLMTPHVVTAPPDATVRWAANLMRGRSIGCLPVVDRGCLRGIVTVCDLLQLIGRSVGRAVTPERRGTHDRVPHRNRHRAAAAGRYA